MSNCNIIPVSNGDSSFHVCFPSFRNGVEMQNLQEFKVKIPDLSLADHKGLSQLFRQSNLEW